jgi:hypothetical protein
MNRKCFIVLSMLLVALTAGCKKSIVISSTGDYPSPDGQYVAHIRIDTQKLVTYSITRVDSTSTLVSGKAGNSFMKFYMCWDPSNNFFIDSEDTTRDLLFHDDTFDATDVTAENYPKLPKPPAEFQNAK